MYSALDENAETYVESFGSETQDLCAAEETNDSPLNMGALVLTSLSHMSQGKDHVVAECAKKATRMGARLGLFADTARPPIHWEAPSKENMRAHS
jgi:hypothetical protein